MRSTKSLILLLIAGGCGLVAAFGFAQAMSSKKTDTVETETIYVTVGPVPIATKLNADHVRPEKWPIDKVPKGAAKSIEEFEGLSPKYPLMENEPIVLARLGSGSDVASIKIPAGHQVMSVKVDKESALSGLVTPGDKVDILVFIRSRGSSDGVQTGTRTILRNLTVFAVNDQISRDPEAEGTTIDAKTVSLLVLPEQSEKLLLARQLGTIHLTLRKPGDSAPIATNGASPRDLLGDSTEGSDGTDDTEPSNEKSDLFGILTKMQAGGSKAVDTSTAPVSGDTPSMVIMSPDGILGKYSFGDDPSGLPSELLEGGGGNEPSLQQSDSSESVSAEPTDEGPVDAETDALDPSILGL